MYDDVDRLVRRELDNGTWTSLVYDDAGRNTSVVQFDDTNAVFASQAYGYDDANRRTWALDQDGTLTTYTYDAGGQQLAANRTAVVGWADLSAEGWQALDEAGWATMVDEGATFGNDRRTYAYDPVGNRTTFVHDDGTITASVYNAADRLQTADDGSEVTTYTYDADGNTTVVENDEGTPGTPGATSSSRPPSNCPTTRRTTPTTTRTCTAW